MEASLPQDTIERPNSESIRAIEATLPHLATKADLERHTRLLIMWLVSAQFALFAAVSALLMYFLC